MDVFRIRLNARRDIKLIDQERHVCPRLVLLFLFLSYYSQFVLVYLFWEVTWKISSLLKLVLVWLHWLGAKKCWFICWLLHTQEHYKNGLLLYYLLLLYSCLWLLILHSMWYTKKIYAKIKYLQNGLNYIQRLINTCQ